MKVPPERFLIDGELRVRRRVLESIPAHPRCEERAVELSVLLVEIDAHGAQPPHERLVERGSAAGDWIEDAQRSLAQRLRFACGMRREVHKKRRELLICFPLILESREQGTRVALNVRKRNRLKQGKRRTFIHVRAIRRWGGHAPDLLESRKHVRAVGEGERELALDFGAFPRFIVDVEGEEIEARLAHLARARKHAGGTLVEDERKLGCSETRSFQPVHPVRAWRDEDIDTHVLSVHRHVPQHAGQRRRNGRRPGLNRSAARALSPKGD